MHLFYFLIGGPPSIKVEDLPNWGLGHIKAAKGIQGIQIRTGPTKEGGLLISDASVPAGQLRYVADQQAWAVAPEKFCVNGRRWAVGYSKAAGIPGPDDLARSRQIDSRPLKLADGRLWNVPVARNYWPTGHTSPDEGPLAKWAYALPQLMQLNEAGEFAPGEVHHEYRRLWDLVVEYEQKLHDALQEYADDQKGDGKVLFDFDSPALVVEALRHNYHLSAVEVSLLGLLDTSTVQQAIDIIRDAETLNKILSEIEEARRKNDQRPEATPVSGLGSTHVDAESVTVTTADTLSV